MPKEKQKILCVDDLRHTEYYGLQNTFDELYAKSKNGEIFDNLIDLILSRENILLAYRNIKTNTGSNTVGTDKLTIKDIGQLTPEKVVEFVRFIVNSKHGYRPKPVRRKDIPKPNGTTRPLGIPCIWDRLVQQCIKQVLEPICEAKFSNNSFGFRPNRSVEHAIQSTYRLLQINKLHYVIEFDIKGFFDNVNHSKLIKQIWAMGIHDKHLIWIIRQILKAPVKMPDNTLVYPDKGTPQGGIISPLLANVVLNELDHWVESQWVNNPVIKKYPAKPNKAGSPNYGASYRAMRYTNLKEMYIIRYADDFRIFCRTKTDAQKSKVAITQWLSERLKLEISEEKTRVVNVKRHYSEFLGFKIKLYPKGKKHIVVSHVCDKAIKRVKESLTKQAKRIAKPLGKRTEELEIKLYNSQVMGVQNYYRIATCVSIDFGKLQNAVRTVLYNRLQTRSYSKLLRTGRKLTAIEQERYGDSKALRFVAGSKEPIYPIGYIQHKSPMINRRGACPYTAEGRKLLHDNLKINTYLMQKLMLQPSYGRSAEYADNRISLFSAQWGKCSVTGREFQVLEDVHCHHKTPTHKGGNDNYANLVLVLEPVHILIHATKQETILHYLKILNLNKEQLRKLNNLREMSGLESINV